MQTVSSIEMDLDFITLRLFCDVVETESFSRAAERNFISQSAVSQRIRSLETHLGQSLLERRKGQTKIIPTDAGQILYEGANLILREIVDLETRLNGLSEEIAGTVRVATVYSVGLHALPGKLKPFLAAYPQVNVHLEYSQTLKIYQDVLCGAIDVGIVACPAPKNGVQIAPFGEESIALICAPEHPLASRKEASLSDLEDLPFIGFTADIPTRRLIDDRLQAAGVKVRIVHAFDNIETIKNLVEIGSGVSLLPEDTVRVEVREGELAMVALSATSAFKRPVGLLLKQSGALRPAVKAFCEAMKLTSGSADA